MSVINIPISRAFIALGSNLENPVHQVHQAIKELTRLPATRLLISSSLYCSAPIGRLDQPDFINAVAQIETQLTPRELLIALLEVEQRYGRIRESLNSPRILDLDILIYDDLQCHEEGLILPHPRMCQRAFVLQPLMEISPTCHIPGHGIITKLVAACSEQRLERIQD